ncbi:uncharacterized protein A1O9_10709 [Exophiala aquamarina CBS 119918]|uniref:RBR-type E3 ubiquitin transferase n=1 Tax=Exophiala aquamarina CBS 119918 TaxID=1182545 RepID=A0A072P0D9_9EURO|nr:uncharacterized protein A1O9_10709 [Exophiala aquamarina CBS 119918]KEF53261.1 hypothetical protein A1O9_10709 [Exophiala aquamarina CBS 119918]
MLTVNAAQPRLSSNGFRLNARVLPVLDVRTQPYRISEVSQFDRSFAEAQLKHEAAAVHDSQRFLRRVASKLARPDSAFTAAALSRHVESNGSAVVAQIYIEKLVAAGVYSSHKVEIPGNLLITAVKHSNLELVKLLASFSSVNTLGIALNIAVLKRQQPIARTLLENGADTDHLPQSTLSIAATADQPIFQFILQAPKQLPHERFGRLCADAINNGRSDTLDLLLRRLPDYHILGEGTPRWNRDMLLQTAIASQYESAFFAIAAATNTWPLTNGNLFLYVLDCARPLILLDMMDALLGLCTFPAESAVHTQLDDLLFRCIEDELEDILQCLLTHKVPIVTRFVTFACERRKRKSLERLLEGNLQGGEQILSSVLTAFGQSAEDLRSKALLQLLHCHNRGRWTQQELLRAVSLNQSHLIGPLIISGASVNWNEGECLKIAISSNNVSLVKALLSHDVALPTLQSTFPLVRQTEPLPRRLITRLFLNKGVSGASVDLSLNQSLCDYSPARDVELLDILISANACCEVHSLLIAMQHSDSDIFDKLRSSSTIRYNGAVEWFKAHHADLFDQVLLDNSSSHMSSSYLMLFLHISGRIPETCRDHGSARRYDCFHRLLEHHTHDRALLDTCLNSLHGLDVLSLLEMAMTVSCFCNVETTNYILSSDPFTKWSKNSIARSLIESTDLHRNNPPVQIPLPKPDISRFSDNRALQCMTTFFLRYIEGTAAASLTTRLLWRHLEELHRCFGGEQWPLATIEFLLSQPINTHSMEFEACLELANSSGQLTTLQTLLDRKLPETTISRLLETDFGSLTIAALDIILNSAAISCVNAETSTLMQRLFEVSLSSHDHRKALLLASRFPHKLRITAALHVLSEGISHNSAIEWFPTILSTVESDQEELELLWRHLQVRLHPEKDQWKVKTLLDAGVTGPAVAETFVRNVRSGNHAIAALILEHWKTDRCASGRESFDFENRVRGPHLEIAAARYPPSHAFFCTLGDALLSAVLNGDLPMCQMLITAQAPFVRGEKTIIEVATKAMDGDTLLAFITICVCRDDFGPAGVDFALLETVKCALPESVKAMVAAGGSVLAYDGDCLKEATAAACCGQMDMLKMLLSLRPDEDSFICVAKETTRLLQSPLDEPQIFCEVFGLLRQSGFQDVSHFNAALTGLCGMKSTQWNHAQVFLGYGASVESTGGACMIQAWAFGNLQLYPQLFSQCKEQSVLDRLFDIAVADHTSGDVARSLRSCEDALVVLAPLLITNLPCHSRSAALSKVASQSSPSAAILELMLQTGAPITELEGDTLYRLSRLNDANINSLIAHSGPAITARLGALQLLFKSEDPLNTSNNRSANGKSDDLGYACFDLLIWPPGTPDAFTRTKHHKALFKTMLAPATQPSCLELIEAFLRTPQGLGFVAAHCKAIGCNSMEELLSTSIAASLDNDGDRQIGLIISAMQVNAPRVLARFELQAAESEQFFDCISDQETHTAEEQIKTSSMYLPATLNQFCLYVENDGFTYELAKVKPEDIGHQHLGLALPRKSVNRLLLAALRRPRLSALIAVLIDAGADPNIVDSEGRSALFLATSRNDCSVMGDLVSKGASVDDGSLHLATCNQNHMAMEILLKAGHSISHQSPLNHNATVLEALMRFDHPKRKVNQFIPTMNLLLKDADLAATIWQARPNLAGIALEGKWPFEFVSALLEFRPRSGVKTTLLRRGCYRFSLLSAIEKWDTDIRLTDTERQQLVARLVELGFQRRYYASEGKQPSDAIGIPDRLLDPDSRDRLQAWKDKECSVCGDRPKAPANIHAHLSAACPTKHSWKDEIICIDCLRLCLESKMFPDGDERRPSEKVTCWAPECGEILSHAIIQKYAETQKFNAYDDALCQQHLHAGQSIAKCAMQTCRGAIWLDPITDKNVTVFSCPICRHRTCNQCNQPYKQHSNKPCPVGEAARANARRIEEEKLTKAFMKKERKCPRCKVLYYRSEGCDHITCGKDTHSTAKSWGCGFEFCYLCGADYNVIRAKGNKFHAKTCQHYA